MGTPGAGFLLRVGAAAWPPAFPGGKTPLGSQRGAELRFSSLGERTGVPTPSSCPPCLHPPRGLRGVGGPPQTLAPSQLPRCGRRVPDTLPCLSGLGPACLFGFHRESRAELPGEAAALQNLPGGGRRLLLLTQATAECGRRGVWAPNYPLFFFFPNLPPVVSGTCLLPRLTRWPWSLDPMS